MSDTKETREKDWRGLPEEEAVRKLVVGAGPRPPLPEDDLAAIESAARAEWSRRYGDRGASRRLGGWWLGLAAAALTGAIGLAWWARKSDTPVGAPPPPAASIEVLTGVVRMRMTDRESAVPISSESLRRSVPAGAELETSERPEEAGRLALRMAGGASVRLDTGTRVKLVSAKLVELDRGAVYVDSGSKPVSQGDVAVQTAAGLFEELGTQFEVRVEGSGTGAVTRLRVREGRVALGRGEGPVIADAGQELIVGADGQVVQKQVAVSGPDWDWVLQSAPMLEIEGLKVREFLDWISRETGWRVELADRKASSLADSVVLHGSIRHLTLTESPSVVLSSSGLGYRLSGGTMVVFVGDENRR